MATAKLLVLVIEIVRELQPLLAQGGGNEKAVRIQGLLREAMAEASQVDNSVPRALERLSAEVAAIQSHPALSVPPLAPEGESHG